MDVWQLVSHQIVFSFLIYSQLLSEDHAIAVLCSTFVLYSVKVYWAHRIISKLGTEYRVIVIEAP